MSFMFEFSRTRDALLVEFDDSSLPCSGVEEASDEESQTESRKSATLFTDDKYEP